MAYSITINDAFIEVKHSGQIDREESERELMEIITTSQSTNISKILYDNTELQVLPPADSIIQFFESIPGNLIHAGFIRPGQASMDLRFAEVIANNNNKNGRLFTSREAALAWLNEFDFEEV